MALGLRLRVQGSGLRDMEGNKRNMKHTMGLFPCLVRHCLLSKNPLESLSSLAIT